MAVGEQRREAGERSWREGRCRRAALGRGSLAAAEYREEAGGVFPSVQAFAGVVGISRRRRSGGRFREVKHFNGFISFCVGPAKQCCFSDTRQGVWKEFHYVSFQVD
ncbi:hypothetical protein VPH35_039097 [Triticum aestivum]